jgi:hypothetical protein
MSCNQTAHPCDHSCHEIVSLLSVSSWFISSTVSATSCQPRAVAGSAAAGKAVVAVAALLRRLGRGAVAATTASSRAASRATRCWAGGQALSRWGGRCKHAFGAASRPKALAVSVTIWCSSSIVSWPSQSTSNRLKVVSVASLSGSGIALNCSDSLGSRI